MVGLIALHSSHILLMGLHMTYTIPLNITGIAAFNIIKKIHNIYTLQNETTSNSIINKFNSINLYRRVDKVCHFNYLSLWYTPYILNDIRLGDMNIVAIFTYCTNIQSSIM